MRLFEFKRISSYMLIASMLILLLVGLLLRDQYTCSFANNMLGLELAKGNDKQAEQKLNLLNVCPQSCYFRTTLYLRQKQLEDALDLWQTCGSVSYHSLSLLPTFFQTGIAARQANKQKDWDKALINYRRMFHQSDTYWSQRFHLQKPRFDDIPEYHQTLTHWYRSKSNHLNATELMRYGLRLWRTGDNDNALAVLDQAVHKSSNNKLSARIVSYRLLVEADMLNSQKLFNQAIERYTLIPTEERASLARDLLMLAQIEKQVSLEPPPLNWRELLFTWEPSLPVSYTLASHQAQLRGAEILEPDLVSDGGSVCVLLFWQVSPSTGDKVIPENWLHVRDELYIQEWCTRNLIQDPGFEWPPLDDNSISNWYNDLYGESGNYPYTETGLVEGNSSRFVCMNNHPEKEKRSGIIQHGLPVKATDRFLLFARMTTTDGAEGSLMGAWVVQNTRNYFYAATSKNNPNDWAWIGSVITPYPKDSIMQVYVVNYETIGKVCVDDLVLIELPE